MSVNQPGGAGLKIATVNLTSAQILAIHTTAVQILPAPGAGFAYVPIFALFNYNFVTTAYTDGGGNIQINVGNLGLIARASAGWWDQGSSQDLFGLNLTASSVAESSHANQPMKIVQSAANPTLGNGTVAVSVVYYTMTVS